MKQTRSSKPIVMYASDDLKRRIQEEADRNNITVSSLLKTIIILTLNDRDKERKQHQQTTPENKPSVNMWG